jgi:hypothetical protein
LFVVVAKEKSVIASASSRELDVFKLRHRRVEGPFGRNVQRQLAQLGTDQFHAPRPAITDIDNLLDKRGNIQIPFAA